MRNSRERGEISFSRCVVVVPSIAYIYIDDHVTTRSVCTHHLLCGVEYGHPICFSIRVDFLRLKLLMREKDKVIC